jgi:hypothetical protein
MKLRTCILAIGLLVLIFQNRALSQDNSLQSDPDKPLGDSKDTKSFGDDLRKVTSGSYKLDIDIDNHELEADIDTAIDEAFRSIEFTFEDIDVQPIEIDLSDLVLNLDHLELDFDFRDINIDRIELDMEDLDIDIDIDDDDFSQD